MQHKMVELATPAVPCSQGTGNDTFLRVRADEGSRMQNLLRICNILFAFLKITYSSREVFRFFSST